MQAFQTLVMGLRFSHKPVVTAPHGHTLGGGAEFALHADRVVAAAETFMGLVETGVGLIPAGGGTKELNRRLISKVMALSPDTPPLPLAQKAFETIGQAKASTSALEARSLGFLTDEDLIVMNPDHLRQNESAVQFVRSFFEAGKPVAAICHAPWMLVEAVVVAGRTLTSWPSLRTDIRNAGGEWVDREVVTDEGLVTSRKPDDIPAFNRKMIEEFAEGLHEPQPTSVRLERSADLRIDPR